MLSKSPLHIKIKHMLTLCVSEHLNLLPSEYLVIYVTFKGVSLYMLWMEKLPKTKKIQFF